MPVMHGGRSCSWALYRSDRVALLFLQILCRNGRTALFKLMAEKLRLRQNFGPPLKNDPTTTKIEVWGALVVQENLLCETFVSL